MKSTQRSLVIRRFRFRIFKRHAPSRGGRRPAHRRIAAEIYIYIYKRYYYIIRGFRLWPRREGVRVTINTDLPVGIKNKSEILQGYERKRRKSRALEIRGIVERNMHPAGAAGGNVTGGITCEKDGSTHVKKIIPGGCVLLLTDHSFIAIA